MAQVKPRRFRRRRWLNRLGFQTTAFAYADLECTEDKRVVDGVPVTKKYVNGDLTISDCTRQITLTIEGDWNTSEKLTKLADLILEARDWVEEAIEWMESTQ